MKKKMGILIGIILIIIVIIFLITRKSYNIKLPSYEELNNIASIQLEENRVNKFISDKDKIKEIYELIRMNDKKTYNKSKDSIPSNANTIIKVTFNYEDSIASFIYVYTKNSKYYMEQPYNGIYEIDKDTFSLLENFF